MFKVVVLQDFYKLSDDQTEFQIRDRYSFCRFLGPPPEGVVPDAKTLSGSRPTDLGDLMNELELINSDHVFKHLDRLNTA